MKKLFNMFTCSLLTLLTLNGSTPMLTIGQQYINFIKQEPTDPFNTKWQLLFASNVHKIVNSTLICTNRDQLIAQMIDIQNTHGVEHVQLLEILDFANSKTSVVRFEVTFKDHTTETIIAILKCNDDGLIQEINEVFGSKNAYQWPS